MASQLTAVEKDLLRTLGADPDNPPPPPEKIDLTIDEMPERVRGGVVWAHGNPQTRVSFKFPGLDIAFHEQVEEAIDSGRVTTREQMLEFLRTL